MHTSRNILVIGGGPAGTLAAISAKKQDPAATVTLLTDEACQPYEKPPLSKTVLLGRARPIDALIAGPGGVESHGVVLETRARCTAIDRAARTVMLGDGRRLTYDSLVIATGSLPRTLPQLPPGMPGVFYLRTDVDALDLERALAASRRLLVVGGGLIGLEVAAVAVERGLSATVLEVAPRILARVCDDDTAALVHAVHQEHGVQIQVCTNVASATPQPDGRIAVVTSAGDTLTADCIVVGTGVLPDETLAAASGLARDEGIVVDAHCCTSDPAIYAAGDVTRFPGPRGLVRLENWRHALDQGAIAGRNAAGAHETYASVPSFWSEQYDLYIQGVGWPAEGRTHVRRSLPGRAALVFEFTDGCLAYAMGVNAQRDMAAARRLIERRVPIEAARLSDPSVPLATLLKR